MENFKIVGHSWETIYSEEAFNIDILIKEELYNKIKEVYEIEKNNEDNYQALLNSQIKAKEILDPIFNDIKEAYIKYNIKLILNNEEELNNFILNCSGECNIDSDDFDDELYFKTGLMEEKLLLLNKEELNDFISETWEYAMDTDYTDSPAIRFEDYNFSTHWSLINITGKL